MPPKKAPVDTWVISPKTGKVIKVGGAAYEALTSIQKASAKKTVKKTVKKTGKEKLKKNVQISKNSPSEMSSKASPPFEFVCIVELLEILPKIIGKTGPIIINSGVITHALGLMNESECAEPNPLKRETRESVVICLEGKATLKNVIDAFKAIKKLPFQEGRSYFFEGIRGPKKERNVRATFYRWSKEGKARPTEMTFETATVFELLWGS